jgi:hypothetical protein
VTGLFILIGGEIDAEIEQAAPSGKEPGDTQLSHASRASDSAGTVSRLAIRTVDGVAGPRPRSAAGRRGMSRCPDKRQLARVHGVPQDTGDTRKENAQWRTGQVTANGRPRSGGPR